LQGKISIKTEKEGSLICLIDLLVGQDFEQNNRKKGHLTCFYKKGYVHKTKDF